jgi:hypothetical protein
VASGDAWWEDIVCAARAERASGGRLGKELQTLVEVAEVLAGTLARITLGRSPALTTVTATLVANRSRSDRAVTARPASPPIFRGDGPTRELDTRIELVDAHDRLVADVHFVWAA